MVLCSANSVISVMENYKVNILLILVVFLIANTGSVSGKYFVSYSKELDHTEYQFKISTDMDKRLGVFFHNPDTMSIGTWRPIGGRAVAITNISLQNNRLCVTVVGIDYNVYSKLIDYDGKLYTSWNRSSECSELPPLTVTPSQPAPQPISPQPIVVTINQPSPVSSPNNQKVINQNAKNYCASNSGEGHYWKCVNDIIYPECRGISGAREDLLQRCYNRYPDRKG